MRTISHCLLSAFLLPAIFLLPAKAQTNAAAGTSVATSKMPDPPYLNLMYYCQSDSLLALEQTAGQMKTRAKVMGFGGAESGFVMAGSRAAIRIRAGENPRFAIKMNMMMGDPTMMIKLYRFESRKGDREAMLSGQGSQEISCNAQKSGNDVFVLSPVAKLAPGEYGFMNMMAMKGGGTKTVSYTFFTFGVD